MHLEQRAHSPAAIYELQWCHLCTKIKAEALLQSFTAKVPISPNPKGTQLCCSLITAVVPASHQNQGQKPYCSLFTAEVLIHLNQRAYSPAAVYQLHWCQLCTKLKGRIPIAVYLLQRCLMHQTQRVHSPSAVYQLQWCQLCTTPRTEALLQFIYCKGAKRTKPKGHIALLQFNTCIGARFAPKSRAEALCSLSVPGHSRVQIAVNNFFAYLVMFFLHPLFVFYLNYLFQSFVTIWSFSYLTMFVDNLVQMPR